MIAVESIHRVTTGAGFALAASSGVIVKIPAPRALKDVSSYRRHITDLGGRAGQNRAAEHRIALSHARIGGERGVLGRCANDQAAALAVLDRRGKRSYI